MAEGEVFNLDKEDVSAEVIRLIPKEVARRHGCIPVRREGDSLIIAMVTPTFSSLDDLKFLTNLQIVVECQSATQIERALEKYYGDQVREDLLCVEDDVGVVEPEPDSLSESTGDAPVVRLVNTILVDAVRRGATIIHLETYEKDFRVRYRLDGQVREIMRPPLRLRDAILARIKVLANFNMKGRGLPQKGVIHLVIGRDKRVDFNVSTMPTTHGENMVLQVLDIEKMQLRLENLGLESRQYKELTAGIATGSGLVLVAGPTGSGKQTTLSSLLVTLNAPDKNIFTAEQTVAVDLPGVNQILLHPENGLDLEAVISNLTSQDVDILMVGESPWGKEDIEALVKTSLSGRLVLAPFQSEDAISTISSLLDVGISPFMLVSSLNLVCAQRLARRICDKCRVCVPMPTEVLIEAGFIKDDADRVCLQKGEGCRYCDHTGFKGLVGIFQVLPMYDEFKKILLRGAPIAELRHEARRFKILTLRQAGLAKVARGLTTIEEVLRVTPAD